MRGRTRTVGPRLRSCLRDFVLLVVGRSSVAGSFVDCASRWVDCGAVESYN